MIYLLEKWSTQSLNENILTHNSTHNLFFSFYEMVLFKSVKNTVQSVLQRK